MHFDSITGSIFIVFFGAALIATIALSLRQSLLVAYMLLGLLLGPWGLEWVSNSEVIEQIGEIGIIFLLFLLGLHLHPQDLMRMLKKMTVVGIVSSLIFAGFGYVIGLLFNFNSVESLIIAAAMTFSSTIIGLKLLPTTVLHHQHTGEVMISVLLLQDILAILVLLLLDVFSNTHTALPQISLTIIALPFLLGVAFVMQRYVLLNLIKRFNKIQEYIFLISIAWCLGMAELARILGLPMEVGAFIGGVALASNPIALFIAESLKPLRDFFLVMFFFAVGASFNLDFLPQILIPALLLTVLVLFIKPLTYRFLLTRVGETPAVGWEVGVRLGQISEFSVLVGYVAATNGLIDASTRSLIQATTIFTFIVSSYWVVKKYPTPVATDERLRRD